MAFKCPGALNIKQPRPEEITCPFCKTTVEIWTDETKAACPGCRHCVFREEKLMSCLDWCAYSKDCVGEKIYNRYLRRKNKNTADKT